MKPLHEADERLITAATTPRRWSRRNRRGAGDALVVPHCSTLGTVEHCRGAGHRCRSPASARRANAGIGFLGGRACAQQDRLSSEADLADFFSRLYTASMCGADTSPSPPSGMLIARSPRNEVAVIRIANTSDLAGIRALMKSVPGIWDETWRPD